MLDPLDSVTGWAAVAQASAVTLETSTVTQGTGSAKWSKSGTGAAEGSVMRKLQAAIDVQAFLTIVQGATVKAKVRHANFTNVSSVAVRLVYRLDTSGVPDVYDDFRLSSFSGGSWNSLSVALKSPTASVGSPTDEHRSKCIALAMVCTMAAAANTVSDLLWDAIEITATASTAQPGCIIFNGERILTPPWSIWTPDLAQDVRVNEGPQSVEANLLARFATLNAGIPQVRMIYRPQSEVHTLEESLRRFGQYAAWNPGFGVARDAGQLIDTTLGGAASAGATSITVASATEFAFLGLTGTQEVGYADLRIGPSAARCYEWCRAIGYSSTTVYLDRPLRHAYESGKAVRSAGYYPSLAMRDGGMPVRLTGSAVHFEFLARETA
jgi:hypothetical protein